MTSDLSIERLWIAMIFTALVANLCSLITLPSFAGEELSSNSTSAAQRPAKRAPTSKPVPLAPPPIADPEPSLSGAPRPNQMAFGDVGHLIVSIESGRYDVPRVELAARLVAAGFEATDEYKLVRDNAARELSGPPDGVGNVSADELRKADQAIVRQIDIIRGAILRPSFAELAKMPGRPQIEGLNIIYLNPL